MKQKFTITAVLVLFTLFAFGQRAEIKKQGRYGPKILEKPLKGLKKEHDIHRPGQFSHRGKGFSYRATLKSINADKQMLDTLIDYEWDEITNQWIKDWKIEWSYDANENMTQGIDYEWNGSLNLWAATYKGAYTYDTNGNMTQSIGYNWNESLSLWAATSKGEYTYDTNGNMTQNIDYDWDETTSQWLESWKDEYTYDANGNMTQGIEYNWDETTNQWVASTKYEYTYDTNGNMTQEIEYNWDETTNQWVEDYKIEYTYDTNGNMTQKIYYDWDETTSQWLESYKDEYTYDANGNMTQEIDYVWDDTTSEWLENYKDEYTYDTNGNMTQNIDYDWDETTNQWVEDCKMLLSYNNTYTLQDLILPPYDLFWAGTNNMLTDIESYEKDDTDTWVGTWKRMYRYSEQNVANVDNIGTIICTLYPNPASDYLYLEFSGQGGKATLDIFDTQGRKVMSEELHTTHKLNIEQLSTGIYFYNLQINGNQQSGKIIKQ